MAHDLGLGDLGKTSSLALGAAQAGRDEIVERMLGHVECRRHEGATAGLGALVDRQLIVRGSSEGHQRAPTWWVSRLRSAATAPSSRAARRSMSARLRRSVIATSSPFSYSG